MKVNFSLKNKSCYRVGMHLKNIGSQNGDSIGDHRGSSLNSSWGKYGVWLFNQWIPYLYAFVYLSVDNTLKTLIWWLSMMLAQLLYSFEILTYWLYWLILLPILACCIFLFYAYCAYLSMMIDLVIWLYALSYPCLAWV